MKMKTLSLTCLLVLAAAGISARAADTDVSSADKTFVEKAAQGGMTEVELGKVAQDQASAPDVKDFGAKMVEDHGKANDELKAIAASKSITIPDSLDAKHQKMVDSLKAKSGKDFDIAYLKAMTKAHDMDNALFEKEASSGQDSDIKAFAAKTDKVVKMHIAMLKDIKSKSM